MFGEAERLSGNHQAAAALAYALGRSGKISEARKILEQMIALLATRYVPAPQIALINLGLNQTDRAVEWLERGLEERSYWMVYLKADPIYDVIRSDARFSRILDAMKFPA